MTTDSTGIRKAELLFVDDEQPLLDGLRQSLRRERRRWNMSFARGGEAALELAAERTFDVVVSDIVMPRMPGAEFLRRFRNMQPASMRLVLSGHAEPQDVLEALPLIHQWMAKPCNRDELLRTLERAIEAHELLHSPPLQNLVGGVAALPPAPRIHQRLASALTVGEAPMEEIAALVGGDPGLSAKFLQLANSAFFALPHTVDQVFDAIRFLGLARVSQVVLASEVFRSLPGGDAATLQRMADRAMAAATLAPKVAADLDLDPNAAATAAVLQDAGILLIEHFQPEEAAAIRTRVTAGADRCAAEREVLGADHCELTAALLACWGLPLPLIGVTGSHHDPAHLARNPLEPAGALQITNALVEAHLHDPGLGTPMQVDALEDQLQDPTARRRLDSWRRAAAAQSTVKETR